jgi:hypothetical protein
VSRRWLNLWPEAKERNKKVDSGALSQASTGHSGEESVSGDTYQAEMSMLYIFKIRRQIN